MELTARYKLVGMSFKVVTHHWVFPEIVYLQKNNKIHEILQFN